MKKIFYTLALLLTVSTLFADLGTVSVTHDGKTLKWEEGSRDYFFMFKSLVTNERDEATTSPSNPQADTCIDLNTGSTYTLSATDIPEDAYIEAAYLTWMGGIEPTKLNDPTDHEVTLSFTNTATPAVTNSANIVAFKQGKQGDPSTFEFEIVSGGSAGQAVFAYRADVTDFFTTIHTLGTENGITLSGMALLGNYNVKGMDCSAASEYVTTSGVIGAWGLVIVYTSEKISPKKIYIYNGLQAYRFQSQDINIAGFQLPDEAVVRLSMMVGEGDPGLAMATDASFQPADPETLALSGQSNADWIQLTNDCNVPFGQDSSGNPFDYVEVFNSISSAYGWNSDTAFCIGGDPYNIDKTKIEYAVDVDTFLLDSKNEPFKTHLKKDDTNFWLKVSANQDQVYTNMIVLSVDTKKPTFDIPPQEDTPSGREKNYCSCSTDADAVCEDRPFYYTVKIQNWGENIANGVTIQDTLPSEVDYIPGTTEYSSAYSWGTKKGTKWNKIDDGADGAFPLDTPYTVAETMGYCADGTCPDTILVRFQVQPKSGLPKHAIIANTVKISEAGGGAYLSNSSIPIRLRFGACPPKPDCEVPAKEDCLGIDIIECKTDEDCSDGFKCIDDICIDQGGGGDETLVTDSELTYSRGKGSPDDGNIGLIPTPSNEMILARFSLYDTASAKGDFSFDNISLSLQKTSAILLTNIKLYYDKNSDGLLDSGDTEISSIAEVTTNNMPLPITKDARLFAANRLHNFIIKGDAEYVGRVASNNKMEILISGATAIQASDKGTLKVKTSGSLMLASWKFEPAKSFIVTIGDKDPAVPAPKDINNNIPIMQLRVKSTEGDEAITGITVKTTQDSERFGESISQLSLVSDDNGNGLFDGQERELGRCEFSTETTICTITSLNITFATAGEQKHLLFVAKLKLGSDKTAQITIPANKLTLTTSTPIYTLPVSSKMFTNTCAQGDASCDGSDGTNTNTIEKDGCSTLFID
ncbi:hypothetical protein KAH37_05750 [bacterium]|nr:hypothetical protein [bacterium]